VVSEGPGREWLAARQETVERGRLVLCDYVPFPQLPEVLASADVLLGILEPVASRFSVPSKIATYLCAARPILAVMHPGNAAAQMIIGAGAGVVLDHSEALRAPEVLRSLLDDPARRERMGDAGRAFAERHFDIDVIAARFEEVILAARA
jgi:colanic acid biosynthesis glycosyl transferase WcaI